MPGVGIHLILFSTRGLYAERAINLPRIQRLTGWEFISLFVSEPLRS